MILLGFGTFRQSHIHSNVKESFFSTDAWARWDSGHYWDIADRGYYAKDCGDGTPRCGNAAWFPGYSLLAKGLHNILGIDRGIALIGIAWGSYVVLIVLINQLLAMRGVAPAQRIILTLTAAVFPGAIYYPAIFPISFFLVMFLLTVFFLEKFPRPQKTNPFFFILFILETFAVTAYSIGWTFCLSFAGASLLVAKRFTKETWVHLLSIAAGFIYVLTLQTAQTGHLWGFFQVQSRYPHGAQIPFWKLRNQFYNFLHDPGDLVAQQSVFLFIVLLAGTAIVVEQFRKNKTLSIDLAIISYCWLTFLLPFATGNIEQSLVRPQSLLLPIILVIGRVEVPKLLCLTGLYLCYRFTFIFGINFFDSSLM